MEKAHPRDIAKDDKIISMLPKGKLTIFEASAGAGRLAYTLSTSGHEVVVSNFKFGNLQFDLPEIEADLNKTIPLPDQHFDVVLCREVIEHVESVPHTLRELNRLLKAGGTLILTFPNRLHLRSRFYHLFTGFYHGMKSPINLSVPMGEAHVNLIGYPEMDYFLRHTGFTPLVSTTSLIKRSDRMLNVIRPLVRFATWYFLLKYKPDAEEHSKITASDISYNREILERITSPALLFGKDVVIAACKGGQTLSGWVA